MSAARVKRSAGPKAKLTKGNYRKKALPFLLKDFEGHCAYCLDPSEFRHPSQSQVDHFNCKLRGRRRHQYINLMLACAACNLIKHDKPVVNPLAKAQRFLNCTEENEFLGHIVEMEDGQWEPATEAGYYHLESIGLRENCHKQKRQARKRIAKQVLGLCTMALQYRTANTEEVHRQMMDTLRSLLDHLGNFPPLVTKDGIIGAKDWLKSNGMDVSVFEG